MGGVGLYGRPLLGLLGHQTRSRSMKPVHGTRATRAAIKAPTQPNTTPAPTDGDELFLRLMCIPYPLPMRLA